MRGRKVIDLSGRVFGRLTVISFAGIKDNGKSKWMCKCECGNYTSVVATNLVSGITSSCGCLKIEMIRSRSLKHGQNTLAGTTSEYIAWQNMKARCYDVKDKSYPDYGGRGIIVCDRWLGDNGFQTFFNDMGSKPSSKHSLDRYPNNENGNYEPSNCRWATKKQQNNNVRTNRIITYKGVNKTMSEWCDELNLNYQRIFRRFELGWSAEDAFENNGKQTCGKPVFQFSEKGELIKEYPSVSEASRQTKIPWTTIKVCISGKSKVAGGYIWKYK